ncbi:MAG: PAS domain-containing sensor histidine kinase, partial [Promethearchaeota archaeon]
SIFFKDLESRYIIANDKTLEAFGLSKEQVIGKNDYEIMQDKEEALKNIEDDREIYATKKAKKAVKQITRTDGNKYWFQFIKVPQFDDKGNVIGIVGISRDITELKKAELEIKETSEELELILDNIPAFIFYKDIKNNFINVNKVLADVYNISKEELAGKSLFDIYPYDEAQAYWDDDLEVIKDGQSKLNIEQLWDTPKGKRWVNTSKIPIKNKNGNVTNILGISMDISERKEAEKTLVTEKDKLAVIIRSIGDGVITTDRDGKIILINKIAENLIGYAQEETVGRQLDEIFKIIDEKTRKPIDNIFKNILDSERIINLPRSTVLITKNGEEWRIEDSGAPLKDKGNKVIGIVLVFRDVTEVRKIETEFMKSQGIESLGELTGGIAHDLNNILTGILGNLNLLRFDFDESNEIYSNIFSAETEVHRARDLTSQLLTISKGGSPIKKRASIEKIIRESSNCIMHGSKISIIYEFSSDLWIVNVTSAQMGQVIQNLVINAFQSMKGEGTIIIGAINEHLKVDNEYSLESGNYVKVSVKDTGCGIPKKVLPKIFNLYFSTKPKGSGLGLSICHSIITRHGGVITVDSKINEGSTFTFYIPALSVTVPLKQEKSDFSH